MHTVNSTEDETRRPMPMHAIAQSAYRYKRLPIQALMLIILFMNPLIDRHRHDDSGKRQTSKLNRRFVHR